MRTSRAHLAIVLVMLACGTAFAQGPYERQRVDNAAADRGRALYAKHCINCHGSTAKGTDRGPDLIRSSIVLRDRLGNLIGAAIRPGANHQAALAANEIVDLSHFLHQRVEAIVSNRNARGPLPVLTGDPDRQQRFLFPARRRGGTQVEATVTVGQQPPVTGTVVRLDDFFVSLRDATGEYHAFNRGPGITVVVNDPLEAHHQLLDRYTDADMHNLTAYLATLK